MHIDFETYSSVNIRTDGSYKYFQSIDFEILLAGYAFDDGPIIDVDMYGGKAFPQEFIDALYDEDIELHAHNANFERNCLKAVGINIPAHRWRCSSVKAAYSGLPLSLGEVSKALDLAKDGKLDTGAALIRYFCVPCKPTKANGFRHRNLPKHDPVKWAEFKRYLRGDVRAERKVDNHPRTFEVPDDEWENYVLDQKINDKGVLIDIEMASRAIEIDLRFKTELMARMRKLTGLVNPNSPVQLRKWLSAQLGVELQSLAKDQVAELIKTAKNRAAVEVLKLRQMASKTSTKKFDAMIRMAGADDVARGLLQFYGAMRTGRWAGRGIQLQNLPKNKMKLLDTARELVRAGDYEALTMLFDNIPNVLSELVRTGLIARKGNTFAVADYSAIEARIIAWLSGEQWRLDVFAGEGNIYETSASKMFNVPLSKCGKGSDYRDKGKIAELALGYQGAVGALKTMGGEKMGLSESEMDHIVKRWRLASPKIVELWRGIEDAALKCLQTGRAVKTDFKGITFRYEQKCLTVQLPSGRKLVYQSPMLSTNQWGKPSIKYKGVNDKKQWTWLDTYGGKLVENIVQAIARDLLAAGLRRADAAGCDIVVHVHDEVVADIENKSTGFVLSELCRILAEPVSWAPGLHLPAEGYITKFYKKD